MEKIIDYIKKNKLFLIIMFLGVLAFFIQLHYVGYSADDYTFGAVSRNYGLIGIIDKVKSYYIEWSGVLCLFTLLIEWGNIIIWKIANCFMVVTIISLAVKMISHSSKIKKEFIAIVLWMCFYILNITISREVLYWLNGNTAYMYTLFKSIIYFYYLYSRLILKTKSKKLDIILLPLVGLWAGWSSPQTGALAVVSSVLLIIWVKFIKKEKIDKLYVVSSIFSLIGFLFLYLAPGNSARMSQVADFANLSIIDKILYRVDDIYNIFFSGWEFGTAAFYLQLAIGLIAIVSIIYSNKMRGKLSYFMKSCSYFIILMSLLMLFARTNIYLSTTINEWIFNFNDTFNIGISNIKVLLPYMLCTIYLTCGVILSIILSIKEKSPFLALMIICALLSQLSMMLAPFGDARTFFCMIVYLSAAIAFLLKLCYEKKIKISGIFMIVFSTYNIYFAIVFILVNSFIKQTSDKKDLVKNDFVVCFIIAILICGPQYVKTIEKYRENKIVYDENVRRILEVKNHNDNHEDKIKEVSLLLPVNPDYSYMPMVGYEWLENDIKRFYDMDLDIKFVEEKIEY